MTVLVYVDMMAYSEFEEIVRNYYRSKARSLPWRSSISPYRVFISEIMLQQTQVNRVVDKFNTFMLRFPDFRSLARAPLSDILRLWQGLGYNRRALYLQQSAHVITSQYKGMLPSDESLLQSLPGVGKNTAGAILAYAFNKPCVFIETNIRTVYLHHFFPNRKAVPDKEILPLVESTVDTNKPREWYWALMDYGTELKKTVPNPSRRSASYSKQSIFTGSLRQVRGALLKILLHHPNSSTRKIKYVMRVLYPQFTAKQENMIGRLLKDMTKEKILVEEKRLYRIP